MRSDTPSALSRAVGALLCAVAEGAKVRYEILAETGRRGGVGVELRGTDRWMCVLQSESDIEAARQALANDAWCIVSLSDSTDQFETATRALVSGSAHFLPMSFARLIASARGVPTDETKKKAKAPPPDHTPLTAREREVLSFVAQGLSNTEIAEAMGISIHTVRTHLASMATKMDSNNRLRMVATATMYGYPEAATRAGGQ